MEMSGDSQPVQDQDRMWLAEEEFTQAPSFVEPYTWKTLEIVREKQKKNEALCPCEVLECVFSGVKGKSVDKWQEEGLKPHLMREISLEDQMLTSSGYGLNGEP